MDPASFLMISGGILCLSAAIALAAMAAAIILDTVL
jgi:hypothetical protein